MAVIHGGELRFCGTPAALRAQYATSSLEAAFLASIEAPADSARRKRA